MSVTLPSYFISHGGGPWPYLDGASRQPFEVLEQSLKAMRRELGETIKAILVISSHWEEPGFAISSASHPGMVYDYSGFPPHTYKIKYGAPGSPLLAARVRKLLTAGGVAARLDADQGFDHGTFSIMQPLYPEGHVPVVQLSIDPSYNARLHYEVGRLLRPLRDEGILIIGSGLSYHNLRQMRSSEGFRASREFDGWLQSTLALEPTRRTSQLLNWKKAPSARAAHPREDHLVPLFTVLGSAENEAAHLTYHQKDFAGGITASSFRFGEASATL